MTSYTAEQIYDALIRQGYDEEAAKTMAQAIGSDRVTEAQMRRGYDAIGAKGAHAPSGQDGAQDSNLAPNLAEGAALAAGIPLAANYWKSVPGQGAKNFGRGAMRFLAPAALGSAASLGTIALTGNNYYDRASDAQLIADLGGSVIGGMYGDKLGEKYVGNLKNKTLAARKILSDATAAKTALEAAEKTGKTSAIKAATKASTDALAKKGAMGVGSKLLGKAAGVTGARALGSVLGAAGGPVGSMVLGTALGYLLPKFLPDGSKAVEKDDKLHTRPAQAVASKPEYHEPFDYMDEVNKSLASMRPDYI